PWQGVVVLPYIFAPAGRPFRCVSDISELRLQEHWYMLVLVTSEDARCVVSKEPEEAPLEAEELQSLGSRVPLMGEEFEPFEAIHARHEEHLDSPKAHLLFFRGRGGKGGGAVIRIHRTFAITTPLSPRSSLPQFHGLTPTPTAVSFSISP
ncbi:hypothetical protein Tco_0194687, partial [Tanacetum coccineum]